MAALRRTFVRSRVIALTLALLTALGATGSWHVDADDPDCPNSLIVHDHAAHNARLGHTPRTEAPTHCAICHWLQLFRSGPATDARIQIGVGRASSGARIAVDSPRTAHRLDLASRAPPVA